MHYNQKGFSLIELLLALTTTLALSAMVFHLFHRNERTVRDQTLLMEMQHTAQVVASQIADEIRMAGQLQQVTPYPGGRRPPPGAARIAAICRQAAGQAEVEPIVRQADRVRAWRYARQLGDGDRGHQPHTHLRGEIGKGVETRGLRG